MRTINLAVIAGDGIGPEVVAEGLKVLDVVAKKYSVEFKKTSYDLGAAFWHRTGEVLPDATLAELANAGEVKEAVVQEAIDKYRIFDVRSADAGNTEGSG